MMNVRYSGSVVQLWSFTDLFKNLVASTSTFAHQEEIDFCWRLKRAGYRFCGTSSSVVYHLGGVPLNTTTPEKHSSTSETTSIRC